MLEREQQITAVNEDMVIIVVKQRKQIQREVRKLFHYDACQPLWRRSLFRVLLVLQKSLSMPALLDNYCALVWVLFVAF